MVGPKTMKVHFLGENQERVTTLVLVALSKSLKKLYGYPRTAREVPAVLDVMKIDGAGFGEPALVFYTHRGRYQLSRQ